ncbi:MAG: hypothetical protein ACR2QG_09065 [Gammaproteobacteria bacterium]
MSILLSACMTTRVEETKDASTGLSPGESVVIIASSYHSTDPAEDAFMECVIKKVQSGKNKLSVHPAEELRDAIFPWLEPRTAPQKAEDLPKLLERPGINERINSREIRYLIWIKGDTERTSGGGSLSCAAGPGAAACFGLAWWENQSAYEATVWDLNDGISAGMVSTSVNGTSVIPALVVPMPFIARTRSAACKGMSNQLKNFVSGGA